MVSRLHSRALLICAMAAITSFSLVSTYATHHWRSASGSAIEAEFVSLEIETVTLEAIDGTMLQIELQDLNMLDQLRARELARQAVLEEQQGNEEAIPLALEKLFGEALVNADEEPVSLSRLKGKKIGIFFSAHWCPPCRSFTPMLVDFYKQMQEEDKPFEIVFVSSDQSQDDMTSYMESAEMPWLAMPYGTKYVRRLKERFGVRGIPKLIIVDDTGDTISMGARSEISYLGPNAYERW